MGSRYTHNITASRSTNWFFEVSRGRVPGHEVVHLDALLPLVDISDGTVDVWTGGKGTSLNYLTSAEIMNVVSTSADDVDETGSGTRKCFLSGVDGDYNRVSEILGMNGTTPVPTVNKYLRINLLSTPFGGGDANLGDITATASVSDSLQAHCQIGSTHDEGCHFTVPLGKSLIPLTLDLDGGKSTPGMQDPFLTVDVDSRIRALGTDLSLVRQKRFHMDTSIGAMVPRDFVLFDPIIERADVRIRISTDTNGSQFRTILYGILYNADIA